MTLLFILERWGTGGTENYVETLGRELVQKRGFEIHLVLLAEDQKKLPEFEWVKSVKVLNAKGRVFRQQLKQIVDVATLSRTHKMRQNT